MILLNFINKERLRTQYFGIRRVTFGTTGYLKKRDPLEVSLLLLKARYYTGCPKKPELLK
jgi:hypothetical protein